MRVYVYGTLKRGYGNHRLLEREGVMMLGHAETLDHFDMINSGFPVIVPNDQGLPVVGEVYDIGDNEDILRSLDALEGEGVMYDRKDIRVKWRYPRPDDEEELNVSVYIGNPEYWGRRIGSSNPLTDPRYVRDGYLEWSR